MRFLLLLFIQIFLLSNLNLYALAVPTVIKREKQNKKTKFEKQLFYLHQFQHTKLLGEIYNNINLSKIESAYRNILIVVTPAYGMGDVMTAIKTAEILEKKYLDFFKINILIKGSDYSIGKNVEKHKNKINPNNIPIYINDLPENLCKQKMLIIEGPGWETTDTTLKKSSIDIENNPSIVITEYNKADLREEALKHGFNYKPYSSRKYFFNLGLGNNQLGIFINENLANYKDSLENKNKEALQLENKILKKYYNQKNKTFFAYICNKNTKNKYAFTRMAASQEKNNKKNIDIFINNPLSQVIKVFFKFDNLDLNFFKEQNIVKIEIISDKNIIIPYNLSNKEGKTLRVIGYPFVSRKDMTTMIKISEKFGAGTGDHSISDKISGRKKFAYDTLIHKKPFYASLQDISIKLNLNKVGAYLKKIKKPLYEDSRLFQGSMISYVRKLDDIGPILNDPELDKEFDILNDYIIKNFNVKPRIIQHVQRIFIHHLYPEIKNFEENLLIKLGKTIDKDTFKIKMLKKLKSLNLLETST